MTLTFIKNAYTDRATGERFETRTFGAAEALATRGRHRLLGVDNVYLDVRSPISASWVFWYGFDGKKPELGLGSALVNGEVVFAGTAKKKATLYAAALLRGENPKTNDRTSKTFAECLEAQIAIELASKPTWGEAVTWERYGKNYFPGIMKLKPAQIDRHRVVEQIVRKWAENPVTAGRALGVIETVMDYAKAWGMCSFDKNPADRELIVTMIGLRPSSDQEEHASVPYAEAPAFALRALQPKGADWQSMGNARKALLVAASIPHRAAEVFQMSRADVDLDTGVWNTPIEHNKKRHVQVNRLPWQVVEILRSIPEVLGNPYFFAGGSVGKAQKASLTHISAGRMREILQDEMKVTGLSNGERKLATVHGFRSTMITYLWEQHSVDRQTLKDMLSHRPANGKKKKEALDHYLRPENIEARAGHLQTWCDYLYPVSFGVDNVRRLAA